MTYDPDSLTARDPKWIARVLPLVRFFNKYYVRLETAGLDHISSGPALFVGNHNGGIMGPDLFCTMGTLAGAGAPVYALAHDFAMRQFTLLGRIIQKFGAVRACPENAGRIFAAGGSALVYPGGDLEAYRRTSRRNEIILGERTGFVRVAQAAGVPIVPIVVAGAHKSAWIFSDGEKIAKSLQLAKRARVSRFPLALCLPWIFAPGPWLPYLPLPFRIRMRVLQPFVPAPSADPQTARAELERRMQEALDSLTRGRPA